jgi:hypothetical protein
MSTGLVFLFAAVFVCGVVTGCCIGSRWIRAGRTLEVILQETGADHEHDSKGDAA